MKRIDELRDLSDDHHTSLVLALRCKRAARAESAPDGLWNLVRETFDACLEPHFRIEEEHLVPALEELGEGEHAARIREEHAALRELAREPAPESEAIARFGALLDDHVRFEERRVFEETQHRLPPGVLAAIAAACRTIPRVCPTAVSE